MKFLRVLFLLFLTTAYATSEESFPKPGWEPKPSPLAGEWSVPGGRYTEFVSQFPKSFNYLLDNNVASREVWILMFDTLLELDELTLDFNPSIASEWSISDDKKVFTFKIDPKAQWSDGQPITAEDVVWTFEAIMKEENLTGVHKVALEEFEKVEALDERTVQFTAKRVHWRNLLGASSIYVLPKHWWKDQDFNRVNFEFPITSGPYVVKEIKEPHSVIMEKRQDYWNAGNPLLEGMWNFDEIEYRFYGDRAVAFEAFKKNEFDIFAVYTSHRWVEGATGDRFDKNWIVKQLVANYSPIGFQGFAMNMREAPFDDPKVRRAMAHLVNREEFNRTLMYNQYFLHKSYWEDLYDAEHPCPNELIEFSPEKARALLSEAGWKPNASTGLLEKDGKPFKFTFLARDASEDKFLLPFKETLRDVGIEMKIELKDWAAWTRDMDEFNFEMTWASWRAVPFKDAEGMWHSKQADVKTSNNYTGFADPEVDALIDSTVEEFDVEKRHEAIRKIDKIVYDATPYVLLWNIRETRLLYWNKFGMPPHVLGRLYNEDGAKRYWWIDPDSEADLEAARENDLPLPPRPYNVNFDDVFTMPAQAEPLQ